MEKLIYLTFAPPDPAAGDDLREHLLGPAAEVIARAGGRRVGVNVHDTEASAANSPAPAPGGEAVHVAQVSVWLDNYQERDGVDEALVATGRRWHAYLVTESLVEDYGTTPHATRREWPDGARSPGVLTVAMIHRPAGMDDATWLHNWHEVQSPASGRLQPRCRYVRNHVWRALDGAAPPCDGIVEEAWPSATHVNDPMLFFNAGDDHSVLEANLTEMMRNVEACLDLARLRSTTMSEYLAC